MASKNLLIVLLAINAILPLNVLAMDYLVGDESGWTTHVDYEAWAKDKAFHVGDKLVFKYNMGDHDVNPVDEKGFTDCQAGPMENALISGDDEIALTTPGKKWFISSVGKDCPHGQKLAITVLEKDSISAPTHHVSAPAPSHNSSTHSPAHSPAASPTASPTNTSSAASPMDSGAPTSSGSVAPQPSDSAALPPATSSAHGIVISEVQMLISAFVLVAMTVMA